MHRAVACALAFAAIVTAAPAARAQEPPRTKEVKEAEKFITTALITKDSAERISRYQRALNPLQIAMTKDPNNARVWLTVGQVYAALHDLPHADSALKKAEALYPAFKPDVTNLRIGGWGEVFNTGVGLMDAKKYDEAITAFETAEAFYSERPEAKVNLGVLYANKGDIAKAEAVFRAAWEITEGPLKATLKPEEAAQWDLYSKIAKSNIAQMQAQLGVNAFEAKKYDEAITSFKQAHELNAFARDYSYNLAQSMFARASQAETEYNRLIEEQKAASTGTKKNPALAKAKGDSAAVLIDPIITDYAAMEPLINQARSADPNNLDLLLLLARSYRTRSMMVKDAAKQAEYSKKTDELLTAHQAMPVELANIVVLTNGPDATIKGIVKNRKLKAGAPVKIHFILIALDGSTIGEQDITVTAPAPEAETPFEGAVKVTGDVGAWKYVVTTE